MPESLSETSGMGPERAAKRRLQHSVHWRGWECSSHEIEAAPGYMIFVSGMLDGKRQTLALDPDEVDELARYLHQAKRYARREVVRGEIR